MVCSVRVWVGWGWGGDVGGGGGGGGGGGTAGTSKWIRMCPCNVVRAMDAGAKKRQKTLPLCRVQIFLKDILMAAKFSKKMNK